MSSLLPSTHTFPEVIRHLIQFAPDAFCLTDDDACAIELPHGFTITTITASIILRPTAHHPRRSAMPQIPDDQLAAIVFQHVRIDGKLRSTYSQDLGTAGRLRARRSAGTWHGETAVNSR